MLTVVCFKWQSDTYRIKYRPEHVNVLEAMVRRHYEGPLRFVCITDDPAGITGETFPLWSDCAGLANASGRYLPSCYRRLKLFDPQTQAALGIRAGERLVQMDLDIAITSRLNVLFDRDDPFVGWAIKGIYHDRVFNGSLWMLRAGAEADVWRRFDPAKSPDEARHARYVGSDQAWISYSLQGRPGWTEADGVYSYPFALAGAPEAPESAKVVVFHGTRKPWLPGMPEWVKTHYRGTKSGRCLVLGTGASVWSDAQRAMEEGRFNGVIASPEASREWPKPVDAIAFSDREAERTAWMLGFTDIVFCGRTA